MGILEADTYQTSEDEKKKKKIQKSTLDEREKFSKARSAVEISSKGINIWAVLYCKILGTILKIHKGGTQTNGPEDKEVNDDVQGLRSER